MQRAADLAHTRPTARRRFTDFHGETPQTLCGLRDEVGPLRRLGVHPTHKHLAPPVRSQNVCRNVDARSGTLRAVDEALPNRFLRVGLHDTPPFRRANCTKHAGTMTKCNNPRREQIIARDITEPLDVLIIGGGFAGTAAGVTLARAQRTVRIIDNGKPRNRFSAHSHGIMGRDGANPMELLDQGRSEFMTFGGEVTQDEVTSLEQTGNAWTATTAEGRQFSARQVLMATGITYELPNIPGLAELWGSRVFHCPYCHGYEARGRDLAVVGGKDPGFTTRMVHLLRKWTDRVTFFTNGLSLSEADRALFEKRGVVFLDAPVSGIQPDPESESGVLVSTSDDPSSTTPGATHAFEACFTGPEFHPNDQLLLAAGCEAESGWVLRQPRGQTSVAGLWTAGNVTSSPDQVSQAMGTGVATAIAIDQSLLDEELQQIQGQAHG